MRFQVLMLIAYPKLLYPLFYYAPRGAHLATLEWISEFKHSLYSTNGDTLRCSPVVLY